MAKADRTYLTSEEIEAGRLHGDEERRTTPHAVAVCYDATNRRFTMELLAGAQVSFTADQVGELVGATDEQLAEVRLSPSGGALIWDSLDVAVATTGLVMDLVAGVGWRRTYRAMLMREITRMTSPKKAASSRENGKKGGRPRKAKQAS